jgi:hypothetical protein
MIRALSEAETPMIATDGVVTLRAPRGADSRLLVEGRDSEFHRWLGPGAEVPEPIAGVWVGSQLVGWVDYDLDHEGELFFARDLT